MLRVLWLGMYVWLGVSLVGVRGLAFRILGYLRLGVSVIWNVVGLYCILGCLGWAYL